MSSTRDRALSENRTDQFETVTRVHLEKLRTRLAVQESRHILWIPTIHYCVLKASPLVPILNQVN
jgi:hypothetical protein